MKRLFPTPSVAGDPERARLFIHQLWSAIEHLENREVSQRELGRYLSLSQPSPSDWTHGNTALHQVEVVLRLLERLPRRWRRELLKAFLREHPSLQGPELAHEPATPGRLRTLLKKARGLTFVLGATVSERTWILTALGHAYAASGPVVGWDARPADWFVPVPGIRYACDPTVPVTADESTDRAAFHLARTLQMSNGLWLRFPEHRAGLRAAARTRQVIVAETLEFEPLQVQNLFPELAGTIDLLALSTPRPGQIHVEFGVA